MHTLVDSLFNLNSGPRIILSTFQSDYRVSDLKSEIHKYVSMLKEHNIGRKKIAVLLSDPFAYISIFLAVNSLGGIFVPLTTKYRVDDLTSILRNIDPHIVFTINELNGFCFKEVVNGWADSCEKETVVFESDDHQTWYEVVCSGEKRESVLEKVDLIFSTSGSTGTPKGIMVDTSSLQFRSDMFVEKFQLSSDDRLYLLSPATSAYGLTWFLGALQTGCHLVIPDDMDFFRMAQQYKTHLCNKIVASPSIFRALYLILQAKSLKNLKHCVLSGERLTSDVLQMMHECPECHFTGSYGLGELGGLLYCDHPHKESGWSVFPNVEYRLEPAESDTGASGEILFRTPGAFTGYYKRPDLTDEIRNLEGWVHTGDLARIDKNNRIEIIGRKKDMIKKGGQQVIPAEVEQVLLEYPTVKQATVIGVSHVIYGEQIVAFVVTNEPIDIRELCKFCAMKIAGYKVPDQVIPINEIPIRNGKIDKLQLRSLFQSLQGASNL